MYTVHGLIVQCRELCGCTIFFFLVTSTQAEPEQKPGQNKPTDNILGTFI